MDILTEGMEEEEKPTPELDFAQAVEHYRELADELLVVREAAVRLSLSARQQYFLEAEQLDVMHYSEIVMLGVDAMITRGLKG